MTARRSEPVRPRHHNCRCIIDPPTLCAWCRTAIEEDDKIQTANNGTVLYHLECFTRSIIGGLNHLRGRCTCCGGDLPPDPPGLTRRDAAAAAVGEWRKHHS